MDISWSSKADPTSDNDFTVLASIPDYNAHFQAAQRNFSYDVTIPNVGTTSFTIFYQEISFIFLNLTNYKTVLTV